MMASFVILVERKERVLREEQVSRVSSVGVMDGAYLVVLCEEGVVHVYDGVVPTAV